MLSKFIEGTEYRIQLKALASVRDPPSKDPLGSLHGDPGRETGQDTPAKDTGSKTGILTHVSVLYYTSKEPVCPRVELILKIIIILLIIFLGFIKSKPC